MQIEETFEMIKVVLVDDEIPALTKMKSLLKPYEHYVVCGEFTDSVKALEQISFSPLRLLSLISHAWYDRN